MYSLPVDGSVSIQSIRHQHPGLGQAEKVQNAEPESEQRLELAGMSVLGLGGAEDDDWGAWGEEPPADLPEADQVCLFVCMSPGECPRWQK